MVVVKIELWPHGDHSRSSILGVVIITNDGTGSVDFGNYDVTLSHTAGVSEQAKNKPYYKKGNVTGFLRKLSPYHLVLRALKSALDG